MITNPLFDATIQATTRALLHFLWQGTALAALLAVVLRAAGPARATFRHGAALLTLVVMFAAPIATVLMGANVGTWGAVLDRGAETGFESPAVAAPVVTVAVQPVAQRQTAVARLSPLVFVTWLLGVLLMAVTQLEGWRRTQRLRRGNPADDALAGDALALAQAQLVRLATRLGVTRPVRLVATGLARVPAVIGWLRPVILLPVATVARLSPEQMAAVLAHELAHIRRHDAAINALQVMVETLLFFHPAVWWTSRQIRDAREQCCDDLAVAACGDRVTYARALAALETLRTPTPAHALAADGSALVARIRRLAGHEPKGGWAGAAFSGALAVTLLVAFGPSLGGLPAEARTGTAETLEGTWDARPKEGRIELDMRFGPTGDHRSNYSVAPEALVSRAGGFALVRDAGTFEFEGQLVEGRGHGTVRFVGDEDFVDDLERLGFTLTTDDLFPMAIHDVSRAFARGLADQGYSDLGSDQLLAFVIHGVTPAMISALRAEGYDRLGSDQLLAFAIHGVTPALVRAVRDETGDAVAADQLVAFAIHGVTPAFIREVSAVVNRPLSADKLIAFAIHRVTPELVRALQAEGVRDLSPDQLIAFRIHKVTPDYVAEMTRLGYVDLSPDRWIELRIHQVDAAFAEQATAREGERPSARRLIDLKIRGFDD